MAESGTRETIRLVVDILVVIVTLYMIIHMFHDVSTFSPTSVQPTPTMMAPGD